MIIDKKTIVLKDGKTCLLRSPQTNDASQLLNYLQTIARETIFVLRYPEDAIPRIDEELVIIENFRNTPNGLMICAFVEGELAGTANVSFHNKIKTKHRGDIAISLVQKFWGLGLGGMMIDNLIQTAKSRGCEQLELEVIQGNQRAISLYEKKGFILYGERKRGIRLKDGNYLSEYLMYRDLKSLNPTVAEV